MTPAQVAEGLILFAQIYGGIGGLVAAAFLLFGVDKVEEAARGAYFFRPLIVPGLIVLWPVVIARWVSLARQVKAKEGCSCSAGTDEHTT